MYRTPQQIAFWRSDEGGEHRGSMGMKMNACRVWAGKYKG